MSSIKSNSYKRFKFIILNFIDSGDYKGFKIFLDAFDTEIPIELKTSIIKSLNKKINLAKKSLKSNLNKFNKDDFININNSMQATHCSMTLDEMESNLRVIQLQYFFLEALNKFKGVIL